ncbi:MAG: serine/threonine protein kinase [Gemmatimonadetes bacterium]|nr:serine/threonine protein kinase [Gemmatimonadota bacterium]
MSGIEGLLAGRILADRYFIERVIGRGGMGAVYGAVDQRLGRPVAVKVMILPAGDPETRERIRLRFHREAQAAARLRHPNIVTVHDFGTDETLGLDYIVMELLEGEDVAARVSRSGPLPADAALSVLRQAARGLAAGHRSGMVHRDVKPGNLFLEVGEHGDTEVRILDFGIAQVAFDDLTLTHLTVAGRGPLSPGYASPEQLAGERRLTPASDVFSLGAVALYLLTGERPFGGSEGRPGEEIAAVLARLEGRAGVTDALRAVLARAMEADPAARFPDAATFREALDAAALGDDGRALELAASQDLEPQTQILTPTTERRGEYAWPGAAAAPDADDRTEFAPPSLGAGALGAAGLAVGAEAASEAASVDAPQAGVPSSPPPSHAGPPLFSAQPPAGATEPGGPPATVDRAPTGAIARPRRKGLLVGLGLAAVLAGGVGLVTYQRQHQSAAIVPPPSVDTTRVDSSSATVDTAAAARAVRQDSIRRDSVEAARTAKLAADSVRRDSAQRAESERLALAQAESIRAANTPPADGIYSSGQLDVGPQLMNRDEVERQLSRRYPSALLNAGASGVVNLQIVIDDRGRVDRNGITVLSASNPAFADPSVEVARRMRFAPGRKGGRAVRTRVQIPINWQSAQ